MGDRRSRKGKAVSPTTRTITLGELRAHSGVLRIDDPWHMYDPVRIKNVPSSRFAIQAQLIQYPEGGVRIAKVHLGFRPEPPDSRKILGMVGVDSATIVLVDADDKKRHWKDVGPERVGCIPLPGQGKVARLIEKRFGLRSRKVSPVASEFDEPISEELEARITEYLQTFPKYAEFPFMYFYVKTMNTRDRIAEAMRDRLWTEVVLDEPSGASLLALSSGFGDGSYPVEGHYRSGELVGAGIELIGPAQDRVLEAFPLLRY
jgi:hypothetical protein